MKISMLMTTYNNPADLVEKSIMSVVNQTHQDFELLIKDGDVSHPATDSPTIRNLIESLGGKVKYTCSKDGPPPNECGHSTHNGPFEAINWCIRQSTGDILSFLSVDDERGEPTVLRDVHEEFELHGSTPFMLYGACEWINRQGRHIAFKQPPIVPITFEGLLYDYTLYTPSIFWNRAVNEKFGVFDEEHYKWCGDLDFWLRVWRGIDTKFTPKVIGKHRRWEVSLSHDNEDIMQVESLGIQIKYGRNV